MTQNMSWIWRLLFGRRAEIKTTTSAESLEPIELEIDTELMTTMETQTVKVKLDHSTAIVNGDVVEVKSLSTPIALPYKPFFKPVHVGTKYSAVMWEGSALVPVPIEFVGQVEYRGKREPFLYRWKRGETEVAYAKFIIPALKFELSGNQGILDASSPVYVESYVIKIPRMELRDVLPKPGSGGDIVGRPAFLPRTEIKMDFYVDVDWDDAWNLYKKLCRK